MENCNMDPNKVGHKYTEEYKQTVRIFCQENSNDLDLTLNWVRQTYPNFNRKILRTWVDEEYRKHINEVRERNNRKWKANHPEKYEQISKTNQKNQIARYGPKRNVKTKIWREGKKDHLAEYHKQRWITNKEKILARKRQRKQQDIAHRILENTRTYIWQQLQKAFVNAGKQFKKNQTTCELIGCTPDDYLQHLRSLYQPGMTDENYGQWHMDHIKPCSLFDLTDNTQLKECFHYTNMQPLWAAENLAKSDKYEEPNQ